MRSEYEANEALAKPASSKARLTKEQKRALEAYKFQERQFDRYMGSVFVNAHGQRHHEAKVTEAYQECKRLGMGVEHGL